MKYALLYLYESETHIERFATREDRDARYKESCEWAFGLLAVTIEREAPPMDGRCRVQHEHTLARCVLDSSHINRSITEHVF